MNCPKCGKLILNAQYKYCPYCGHKNTNNPILRYIIGSNKTVRLSEYGNRQKRRKLLSRLVVGLVLAVYLLCLNYATLTEGTASFVIRDFMRGLGGSFCFAIPLIPCLFATYEDRESYLAFIDILMVLAVFAGIHVFFVRRIMVERMTIAGYSIFVEKSYGYGQGGGAIGAILAWPLYRYFGEVGGFIAAFFIVIICLVVTGKTRRMAMIMSGIIKEREHKRNGIQSVRGNPSVENENEKKMADEQLHTDDLQENPAEYEYEYTFPPLDLLEASEEDNPMINQYDRGKARKLVDTLESFHVHAQLVGINHGPAATRFDLQLPLGMKINRITSLSNEIALHLAATSVRVRGPIPGKEAIGIEISNDEVEIVHLRDVLESKKAKNHLSNVMVGLGKDDIGNIVVADIAKMPHALIAGQTGSGKSMCIHSIIMSILFRASPKEVRMILIDSKTSELSIYNDIPHLVCPVISNSDQALSALDWTVEEMKMRNKLLSQKRVRSINGYNDALTEGERTMPHMVVIIDELADLMRTNAGEMEYYICQLGQQGSDVGIHVIVSTFRPFAEIFTGSMRNVFLTRIAFATTSEIDSRMILGISGVERLHGTGDMLYLRKGEDKPRKVWGSYISQEEIHAVVEYIKQNNVAQYDPDIISHMERAMYPDLEAYYREYDPKLPEAIDIVLELGQASVSMLQRRMRLGYARCGRLIDEMTRRGIISEADGSKPRTVLMTREQINELFEDSD